MSTLFPAEKERPFTHKIVDKSMHNAIIVNIPTLKDDENLNLFTSSSFIIYEIYYSDNIFIGPSSDAVTNCLAYSLVVTCISAGVPAYTTCPLYNIITLSAVLSIVDIWCVTTTDAAFVSSFSLT